MCVCVWPGGWKHHCALSHRVSIRGICCLWCISHSCLILTSAAPPASPFLWFYVLLPPLLTQFKQAAVCRWRVLIPDMNLTLLQWADFPFPAVFYFLIWFFLKKFKKKVVIGIKHYFSPFDSIRLCRLFLLFSTLILPASLSLSAPPVFPGFFSRLPLNNESISP